MKAGRKSSCNGRVDFSIFPFRRGPNVVVVVTRYDDSLHGATVYSFRRNLAISHYVIRRILEEGEPKYK